MLTDIVVYLVKIQNKINTKEKILQTVKLLKNYKAQIDAIGMLKYSALGVVYSNINNFYNSIIMSIRKSLETEYDDNADVKVNSIWTILSEIFDLIQLISNQLQEISQIKLFSTWNLMQKEEILLNTLFKNVEFVRTRVQVIMNYIFRWNHSPMIFS